MVKFFDFPGQPAYEHFRRGLITDAKDINSTGIIWTVLYQTYFMDHKTFILSHNRDAPESVGQHSFPAIHYYYAPAAGSQEAKFEIAVLVEAMDMNDPNRNWNADATYAYKYLKALDEANPSHKSYGVISAGTNFVLFEVIGRGAPNYLIGSATSPASFLDPGNRAQIEVEIEKIRSVAESGLCKFLPDIRNAPVSSTEGVVKGHNTVTTTKTQGTSAPSSSTGAKQAHSMGKTAVSAPARSASPAQSSGSASRSTSARN